MTVNVYVELDAERIREQIRTHVVEILDERDRARDLAVSLEQQLDTLRTAAAAGLEILRPMAVSIDDDDEVRTAVADLETALAVPPVSTYGATCSCPDAAVDGHVCEVSA